MIDFETELRMIKLKELILRSKKKRSRLERQELPRSIQNITKENIIYTDHFVTNLKKRFNRSLNSRVQHTLFWRLMENYKWWNIYRVRDKNYKTRFALFSKTKKYVFDYIDDKFIFVTVMKR